MTARRLCPCASCMDSESCLGHPAGQLSTRVDGPMPSAVCVAPYSSYAHRAARVREITTACAQAQQLGVELRVVLDIYDKRREYMSTCRHCVTTRHDHVKTCHKNVASCHHVTETSQKCHGNVNIVSPHVDMLTYTVVWARLGWGVVTA